jgi:transglutaminase-like putative cysteine protease
MMNLETRAPMHAVTRQIPEGDAGTAATIAAMRELIDQGKKDPVVYELARQMLRKARVSAFDAEGECRAVYQSVLRNMRFTRDIRGKETLHAARELVRLQMGDCDDYTILMCSLLESIGYQTRIITVAGDPRDPETFTHVFPEVSIGGRWVAVDAARKNPAFGKRPTNTFRTRWWETQSPAFADVAGLAGLIPGPAPYLTNLRPQNPRMPARLRAALGSYLLMPRRAPAYAPRGNGNYGVPAMRGLGQTDESFNFAQLPTDITAAEVGTANIITALRANPNNLSPTTSIYGSSYSSLANVNWTPYLLLGGAALVLVMVMRSRNG